MDAETLEALEGSIDKWRRIVQEGAEDNGGYDCPLCSLFQKDTCDGCPVHMRTGQDDCIGSPYEGWLSARRIGPKKYSRFADTPEKLAAARAELDFLRSLLPQKEETP